MEFESEISDQNSRNSLEARLLPAAEEQETPERLLRRQLIAECLGTAMLATCISLNASGTTVGFFLAALVYAFAHISGSNFNPAVSIAIWLRGRMSLKKAGLYCLVQILGAFLGAAASLAISKAVSAKSIPDPGFPMPNKDLMNIPLLAVFLAEFIGSFALITVVLTVATTKANEDNSFFGFAIGATVTMGALTVGGISGGAFNPAIGIALPLVAGHPDISQTMYLAGPILGGIAAVGVFRLIADPIDLKD